MDFQNDRVKRDYALFFLAILFGGFAGSFVDATLNNYLNEVYKISNTQRTWLELPRELPGFLVMFTSAMLFFMGSRTMAGFARLITGFGILLVGLTLKNYSLMLVWLFLFSSGQHLFMPISPDIGMAFAKEGDHGKTLGKFAGAENTAYIAGSLVVFLGFRFLHFNFTASFAIAALCFIVSAVLIFMMEKNKPVPVKTRFIMKKKYSLYYWLSILFGTRKQIFLTFAPWVLVTVFMQKVEMMALLLFIGGVIGIWFKPALGHLIDNIGERKIIVAEGVLLVIVCFGYGFSRDIFPAEIALLVTFGCFIADQLLMSVSMARATYLRKIGDSKEEVTSTLTMGITFDHVFSISVALIGGLIWNSVGYKYIFLMGCGIAAVSAVSGMFIKLPEKKA